MIPLAGDALATSGKFIRATVKSSDEVLAGVRVLAKHGDEGVDAVKALAKNADDVVVAGAKGSKWKFGQASVKSTFAHGSFKGKSIAEVAKGLRAGKISPNQLPVEYMVRNGQKVALNNRSLTALRRVGMEPTKLINRTGNKMFEDLLNAHLKGGVPSDFIRIRGGAAGTSLISP